MTQTSGTSAWQQAIDAAMRPGKARHFFTMVQVLSRLTDDPLDAPRPSDAQYRAARVRFAHAATLCFEAQEVCAVHLSDEAGATRFTVLGHLMGLLGTTSPLPQALTDNLTHDALPKALQHFFATVYHRLIEQVVERYRQTHPASMLRSDYADVWSRRLMAWTPVLDALPASLRARYRRPLMRMASASSDLPVVVDDVLAQRGILARVRVRPMTGGWVRLDGGQTCTLGQSSCALGQSAVLGQYASLPSSALALDIYPETPEACRQLWESWALYQEITALVGATTPLQTRCDVHVCMQPHMAVAMRLGADGRLGLGSFLGTPTGVVRLPYVSPQAPMAEAPV